MQIRVKTIIVPERFSNRDILIISTETECDFYFTAIKIKGSLII